MQTLLAFLKKILGARIIRVALAGGAGFVVQTTIFEILGIWLGWVRPSTAVAIGAELAILSIFFLNNKYSFPDRGKHEPLLKRLITFHLVSSGSLIIQWCLVFLAENLTSNLLLLHSAYLLGIALGFISNYVGYHLFVWKRAPTATPQEL